MKYQTCWIRDDASPNFDDYVIVHSQQIGHAEVLKAEEHLGQENNPSVITDDAMAFIVFLDSKLNTPDIRLELKRESLRRLESKINLAG